MLTTQLPGFKDITHDSQKTFRALLEALANPGNPLNIAVDMTPPKGLTASSAAACLTLTDLETAVWLQPDLASDVKDWLRFHAGCRFTTTASKADFAVVADVENIDLKQFCWGSAEAPEASTTLLIQVNALQGGETVTLSGPGILHRQKISPQLPLSFWQQWQANYSAYPQGVDAFLFDAHSVLGLPRTACAVVQLDEA
ncbi:MAG: phosphonate C-P lyase system protein PhnH [Phormidesmis sp.]